MGEQLDLPKQDCCMTTEQPGIAPAVHPLDCWSDAARIAHQGLSLLVFC